MVVTKTSHEVINEIMSQCISKYMLKIIQVFQTNMLNLRRNKESETWTNQET
jgi:hypothetical protein